MSITGGLLTFVVVLLVALLAVELFLGVLLHRLRRNFQWLILRSRDACPRIDPEAIDKFVEQSYEPELGWVLKPGRVGKEIVKTAGESGSGGYPSSQYHINEWGCRLNPGHEHLPHVISTYGDSFVFSRQVNDDQTWQWHLSEMTQTNVTNWGVGNYGIDQALLRLKREYPKHPSQVVLLASVPETLVRILSTWKHYAEYGNTLAFKPRYRVEGGRARLCPNPIDHPDKLKMIPEIIGDLQRDDYWYAHKFKKDLLTFPYLISLSRNARRHVPLIYSLILRELAQRDMGLFGRCKNRPWELILRYNAAYANELDGSDEAVEVFEAILDDFLAYARREHFQPVYVLFPYRDDLRRIESGRPYFENTRRLIARKMPFIDVAESLRGKPDVSDLYLNDFYGGHLSARGNRAVSRIILGGLKGMDLLPVSARLCEEPVG